jgi:hypothetical protein
MAIIMVGGSRHVTTSTGTPALLRWTADDDDDPVFVYRPHKTGYLEGRKKEKKKRDVKEGGK